MMNSFNYFRSHATEPVSILISRLSDTVLDEVTHVIDKHTKYSSYLFRGYAGIATLLTCPFLIYLFGGNTQVIELTYGVLACISIQFLLFQFYCAAQYKLRKYYIVKAFVNTVTSPPAITLFSKLFELPETSTQEQEQTRQPRTRADQFLELVVPAYISAAEELILNHVPDDAITMNKLTNNSIVYILDDCVPSLVSEETLQTLVCNSQDSIINPFTNLPVKKIRKRRLRIVDA